MLICENGGSRESDCNFFLCNLYVAFTQTFSIYCKLLLFPLCTGRCINLEMFVLFVFVLLLKFFWKFSSFSLFVPCYIAPNGNRIPARIMSQSDGSFKVEWTPTSTGKIFTRNFIVNIYYCKYLHQVLNGVTSG